MVDTPAPIFILTMDARTQPDKTIDVPEDLYLDRYWTHNELAIRELRRERSEALEQINIFESQGKQLRSCQVRRGTAMVEKDGSQVLQTAIKMLKDRNSLIVDHEIDGDEERMARGDHVLTKLEGLSQSITSRLEGM